MTVNSAVIARLIIIAALAALAIVSPSALARAAATLALIIAATGYGHLLGRRGREY